MSSSLTLIAPLGLVAPLDGAWLGDDLEVRRMRDSDVEPLGRLYFEAYDPGVACDSLADAVADIAASFDGAYGDFWFESSPLVEENGQIVAALMTVLCAPWEDTPDCPFIIELFTARTHRRQGFARLLISRCMSSAFEAGEESVALRVVSSNTSALTMYEALGFSTWSGSKEAGG